MFHMIVIGSVLGISLVLGGMLSLIIGWSFEAFIWISPNVVFIDSLYLGIIALISVYFTRYLVTKTSKVLPILLLSFGLMFGAGILAILGFFLANPASFLYSESRTVSFLLINLLFFSTINIIGSGFVIFQNTVVNKEKALHEEKVLKKQMELKFLSAKINPHFLFNSLNLLVSLLKTPEKAEETLIDLSELLRYQLDISDAQTVSLETELDVVEKYLSIQKLRFGDKLIYQIDCQTNGEIPPLTIQPLVENSIKHNIELTEQLAITVSITKEDKRLILSVVDSMARLNNQMLDHGVGLSVTKKRVEHFGGTFSINNGGIEISFGHD